MTSHSAYAQNQTAREVAIGTIVVTGGTSLNSNMTNAPPSGQIVHAQLLSSDYDWTHMYLFSAVCP